MSHKLISRSPDLKKLRDEGYGLETRGAYLLVHDVPYVNANKEIKFGTLVSSLTLSAERTARPDNHVIYFTGEYPCNCDGTPISAIRHNSGNQVLDANLGITVNHSFSNRPKNGFNDYYEKVTSYIGVISAQAESIDKTVMAKNFKVIESKNADSIFKYLDTNSSRAEINTISAKLENHKIAIIGLGGTGSYVLDFIAKTPMKDIHIFDGDLFLQHNAFRAPGAASLEQLEMQLKKVDYLHRIYSNMRISIIPHAYHLGTTNADEVLGMNFVFICIDDGESKKVIIEKLVAAGISFCDAGMGVEVEGNALTGIVRTTTSTAAKRDHIAGKISFATSADNAYSQNIQIAELNALNAALAVIKWKKLIGFYHDLGKEHDAAYLISTNAMINDDTSP
jgi:hypothetical protein